MINVFVINWLIDCIGYGNGKVKIQNFLYSSLMHAIHMDQANLNLNDSLTLHTVEEVSAWMHRKRKTMFQKWCDNCLSHAHLGPATANPGQCVSWCTAGSKQLSSEWNTRKPGR
jgi:hypothetical protein